VFKIQLDTNRSPPPPLTALFGDLLDVAPGGAPDVVTANAISVAYATGGQEATILVSKNASRYRIQSSTIEALWLLTSELLRRLKVLGPLSGEQPVPEVTFEFTDELPLQELFSAIDTHFQCRRDLAASHATLANLAQQYRSIQKRLIVRFRERNPAPLNSLELLFEHTYRALREKAEVVETQTRALDSHSNALSCTTHLMLLLTRYKLRLPREDFDVLRHFLSPIVEETGDIGWEEATMAAATHLLRTGLGKSKTDPSSPTSTTTPPPLQPLTDTAKLKKHLVMVFDRLGKGGRIADVIQPPPRRPPPASAARSNPALLPDGSLVPIDGAHQMPRPLEEDAGPAVTLDDLNPVPLGQD
jgi:Bardet-Biedl syndrome 9 protein